MQLNRNRVKEIYDFYTSKTQAKLRAAYIERFGFHYNTFRNKLNPNKNFDFTGEELKFIEEWHQKNSGAEKLNSQDQPVASQP